MTYHSADLAFPCQPTALRPAHPPFAAGHALARTRLWPGFLTLLLVLSGFGGTSVIAAIPSAQKAEPSNQPAAAQVWLTTLDDFGKLGPRKVRLLDWGPQGPILDSPGNSASSTRRPAAQQDWMRLEFPNPGPSSNLNPSSGANSDSGARQPDSPALLIPGEVQLAATLQWELSATAATPWQLELTDGSRLLGSPVDGDGDQLSWAIGQGAQLQLLMIDLLWVRHLSKRQLSPYAVVENDTLVLATPSGGLDRRQGWLESMDSNGVEFLEGENTVVHAWERVQGLKLFEEDLDQGQAEATVWLEWRDGSVLAVFPKNIVDGHLHARTSWGSALNIPLAQIAAIDRRRGPFADLTQLPPDGQDFPSSKVLDWSPKIGRSVEGRQLNLQGDTPAVGWGVKAPTRLVWKQNSPGVFSCWVGVDEEVRNHRELAPLEFLVLLDGVVIASSGPVAIGQPPKALRADFAQAGKLELLCRSVGGPKAGGSHGDWIRPRVWRK